MDIVAHNYDEWKLKDEIVQLSDAESSSEENDCSESLAQSIHFYLFQELALRIKSLLNSSRKGDPICHSVMSFDALSLNY